MWQDETLTISKTFTKAMLQGIIPIESIVALLAIMMEPYHAPELIAQDNELDLELVIRVFHFLETGQIVTEDGEIVLEMVRNPEKNTQNPATEHLVSETIYDMFKRVWPNAVGPAPDMVESLLEESNSDREIINDVVLILEMSDTPIHTPPTLALWWLKNKDHNAIREEADILRRTKAKSANTIITRTLRESEEKIKRMPQPGASPERIAMLRSLKEKLSG